MNILDKIYERAKANPQKVAFPEAANEKIMQAAFETGKEGHIVPILVGDKAKLSALAVERGYDTDVFRYAELEDESYKAELVQRYLNLPGTVLKEKAIMRRLADPLNFALFMEAVGDADVTFAGIDYTTEDVLFGGQQIIGLKDGLTSISSIGLCDIPGYEGSEGSLLAITDSAVTTNPNSEAAEIAALLTKSRSC